MDVNTAKESRMYFLGAFSHQIYDTLALMTLFQQKCFIVIFNSKNNN